MGLSLRFNRFGVNVLVEIARVELVNFPETPRRNIRTRREIGWLSTQRKNLMLDFESTIFCTSTNILYKYKYLCFAINEYNFSKISIIAIRAFQDTFGILNSTQC